MIEKNKSIFSNQRGTTLVELLVSISIIVIITGSVLANFRVGERQNNLNNAVQQMVSEIRMVQDYALSLKVKNTTAPIGGWGIYINTQNNANRLFYKVFADDDNSHWCQNFNSCNTGHVELYKTIYLPVGVTISSVTVNGFVSAARFSVAFIPPDPTVTICAGGYAALTCLWTNAQITLSNNSRSKTITINKFGLIDVQ